MEETNTFNSQIAPDIEQWGITGGEITDGDLMAAGLPTNPYAHVPPVQ